MVTTETVKTDLEEIKYYYENQKELEIAARSIGECGVASKVKRYNEAITHAPVKLYRLYTALYINGISQFEYALNIDRSKNRVYIANRELRRYFADYFNRQTDT